jgi:hypothetical protein
MVFRDQSDHHRRSDPGAALNMAARLQSLMVVTGASTREALWAVQLMERKAAVARWRTGEYVARRRSVSGATGGERRS